MKYNKLTFTFLSATALVVGCDNQETTTQRFEKVQTKTEEAARDMKDYSYAQKAEFTEYMQSQLTGIKNELDQLAAKIEKSNDAAKAEAQPKLQALREKADQLGKQLGEARNATESTWDSVKAGSKKAFDELKNDFQQARQWVSEKIAP